MPGGKGVIHAPVRAQVKIDPHLLVMRVNKNYKLEYILPINMEYGLTYQNGVKP